MAAGIADEFQKQVRAAWSAFELRELVALNYTDVVKSETRTGSLNDT